jgi:hypothetical protein
MGGKSLFDDGSTCGLINGVRMESELANPGALLISGCATIGHVTKDVGK